VARTWLDNAFWETPKKEILNAISEEQVDNKQIRQVHKLLSFLVRRRLKLLPRKDLRKNKLKLNLRNKKNSNKNVLRNLRSCSNIN
jgi:hypothetical protein